jgi:hypothetical protein
MTLQDFARFSECFTKTALACGAGVLAGFGLINVITDRLHAATLQQCTEQRWPAHQHQEHVDFCKAYLAGDFN